MLSYLLFMGQKLLITDDGSQKFIQTKDRHYKANLKFQIDWLRNYLQQALQV